MEDNEVFAPTPIDVLDNFFKGGINDLPHLVVPIVVRERWLI